MALLTVKTIMEEIYFSFIMKSSYDSALYSLTGNHAAGLLNHFSN